MNGETFDVDPDFSVIFGFRSTISLIGLATGVVGFYLFERKWDNEGSRVLEAPHEVAGDQELGEVKESSSSYVNMNDPDKVVGQNFHASGARDLVRVQTADSTDQKYHPEKTAASHTDHFVSVVAAQYYGTPEAVRDELAAALPLPTMMLFGLALWSLSFLLDPAIGGFRIYKNFYNITCFVLALALGPLMAFPVRSAIIERRIHRKKALMAALISDLLLIAIGSVLDPEVDAPWYLNIFGVFFIFSSTVVFMASRKMGFIWIFEGKPQTNDKICTQNIGPLLLVFGVFLLWIGTNGVVLEDLNNSYVPFWTTSSRGVSVFIAGMGLIVPGQLFIDYAFDQGSLPATPGLFEKFVYKLNGNTFSALAREHISRFDIVLWFARLLETPFLGTVGWILMGVSSFMPFGVTPLSIQKILAMSFCFAIPVVRYGLVTPALWRSDDEAYQKWLIVYYGLMLGLVISISLAHGIALLFSLLGVGTLLAGERREVTDERKKGILWLTESPPTVNPSPQVYGLGMPLYVLGWIMLCTAMSIPM